MDQHLLAGGEQAAVVVEQAAVDVQALARALDDLCGHAHFRAGMSFVEVAQMRLHGEVAATRGDVRGIAAHQLHDAIAGATEELEIMGLVHVTVVVGPVPRYGPLDGEHGGRPVGRRTRGKQARVVL